MPDSLILPNGRARLGVCDEPLDVINYRDFDLRTPMGRSASSMARWLGFNQFEFLGAVCDDIAFGVALANVRYAGTGFAYVHNPATRRRTEHSVTRPLGMRFDMVQTPERGTSRLDTRVLRVEMEALEGGRRLRASAKGLEIDALFAEGAMTPMRICTSAGATGFVYARKTVGHAVSGTLTWEGEAFDLGAVGALGHHDWSAGYMRRETFWNWGCIAGRLADGRVVGLNASCGVNETSFTESCFWLDGALHRLPSLHFAYDIDDFYAPWRITDERGRVDLAFSPEGAHEERINAGIAASNFTQLFGWYSGSLTTKVGERVSFERLPGYAEWHYAKW